VLSKVVVDGQFFALLDGAKAHIKDVALHDAADQVRLATVIDDFRATPADGAVDGPIIVDPEHVCADAPVAAFRFAPFDTLAGVLDDFAIRGNLLLGVDSIPVDLRPADRHFEAGELEIEDRSFDRCGSHGFYEGSDGAAIHEAVPGTGDKESVCHTCFPARTR